MKILVAGELNVDLVLQNYSSFPMLGREVLVEEVSLTLGSASAICASALSKLGNEVGFAGKVGRDAWGEICLQSLANAGVDCSLIISDPALKTGITVSITSAKDRALVTYLGASAESRAGDVHAENFVGVDHLHVSSFYLQAALRSGLKALLARAHAHGLTTSLDPGFDPQERWDGGLIEVLDEVDVFLPNEVELEAITGEPNPAAALRRLENGKTLTVAKLGSEGCVAIENGTLVAVPAFRVQTVDTTGAGDTFNAGFLHAWLAKWKLEDAMRFGAACGALSTLAPGGTGNQPTPAQARDFMAEQSRRQSRSEIGAAQ
jgi:sugar/nucleoside kinase (ribokinase family)